MSNCIYKKLHGDNTSKYIETEGITWFECTNMRSGCYRRECIGEEPCANATFLKDLQKMAANTAEVEMKNYDVVSKPAHYTEGRKYEPKDVIRDWGLNFNLGNVVKYVSRAGRKDDILQDLKKAREYLGFEIDAIEKERE